MPSDPQALPPSAPSPAPGGEGTIGEELRLLSGLLQGLVGRERRLLLARALLQGLAALAMGALLAGIVVSLGADRLLGRVLVFGLGGLGLVLALLLPLLPGFAGDLTADRGALLERARHWALARVSRFLSVGDAGVPHE